MVLVKSPKQSLWEGRRKGLSRRIAGMVPLLREAAEPGNELPSSSETGLIPPEARFFHRTVISSL